MRPVAMGDPRRAPDRGLPIRSEGPPGSRNLDYDAEGRRLLELIRSGRGQFHDLDVVAQHPGGGKVYVGNYTSAQKRDILDAHGIRHIVNCQDLSSENYHEKDPEFSYFRFPISFWWKDAREISSQDTALADKTAIAYFNRLFEWGDPVLASGRNILVHCLAGAHRAGTTGVAYLMHLENRRFPEALQLAQQRRGQINPIGTLLDLVKRYDNAVFRTGAAQDGEKEAGPSKYSL